MPAMKPVDFLGLPVHPVALWPLVHWLDGQIQAGQRRILLGLYAACVPAALRSSRYRAALQGADRVYADGMGIVWGSRLLGRPVPEKLATTDLLPPIAALAATRGYRVFLLGGAPGVAEQTAARLRQTHPGLQVVGTLDGFFTDEETVFAALQAAQPDILFVGLGVPKQEIWVSEHRERLAAKAILTCGGLFDFASGRVRRAPSWMVQLGFEWFYRLLVEPKRLWRRYLIDNARFVWALGRGIGKERLWGH